MSPKRKFRTTTQRLSRVNAIERLPGESQMDAAFRVYKKDHPRTKFDKFQTAVAGLAGSNKSHQEISRATGIRPNSIGEIEGAFQLRNEAEKERILSDTRGKGRKLEDQPGGMEKVQRILELMKPDSGMTESAICKQEGIDVSTLQRLRRDYPDVRPDEAHHGIRGQAISKAKTKLPEDRALELLKERLLRKGRLEHAHSIGRVREILGEEGIQFTSSGVSTFAKKHEGKTGRNAKINAHLGKLHQHGRLYENTKPYDPNAYRPLPKPRPIKTRTGPWLYPRSDFDGTNHRTLEHYYRMGNIGQGIIAVGSRGMDEKHAERVIRDLEKHYKGAAVA